MGGGGRHRAHLGSLVDAGAGSDVGAIPLSHSGVSFRQWQRVYQSHGGPVAQQIAGGANQVAATAQQRQRSGGNQERLGHSQAHWLRPHRLRACGSIRPILSPVLQSVFELSPALRSAGAERYSPGQTKASVSLVCHALANPEAVARLGRVASCGFNRGSTRSNRQCEIRHSGGRRDAGRQTQTIPPFAPPAERLRKRRAMEMTGGGKRGKPKPGFPSFPTALGNRGCDSHSPCAAWKSGKPKAGFPLSHLLFLPLKSNQERKPGGGSLRSRLQAHSSMRKCYGGG